MTDADRHTDRYGTRSAEGLAEGLWDDPWVTIETDMDRFKQNCAGTKLSTATLM